MGSSEEQSEKLTLETDQKRSSRSIPSHFLVILISPHPEKFCKANFKLRQGTSEAEANETHGSKMEEAHVSVCAKVKHTSKWHHYTTARKTVSLLILKLWFPFPLSVQPCFYLISHYKDKSATYVLWHKQQLNVVICQKRKLFQIEAPLCFSNSEQFCVTLIQLQSWNFTEMRKLNFHCVLLYPLYSGILWKRYVHSVSYIWAGMHTSFSFS